MSLPRQMDSHSATAQQSVFILRDADAFGLTLEETNGRVRVKAMSLPGAGGLFPQDGIECQSLETALNELFDARFKSVRIRYTASTMNRNTFRGDRSVHDVKYSKKADALAIKEKYLEAVATYGLVSDEDALVVANRCSALQLARRVDEASMEANRMIERWPKWEMGYARRAACQIELHDVHGAVRTLIQGLVQAPDNPSLLWRMRTYIPENEREITCLGTDSETMISVFRTDYFKSTPVTSMNAFSPVVSETGLKITTSSFNPLLPAGSWAIEINGVPAATLPFQILKSRLVSDMQAVAIVWRLPSADMKSPSTTALPSNSSYGRSGMYSNSPLRDIENAHDNPDEKQIALRLSAVPQSFDQVYVFGAGEMKCNGDYFPQGTRNERPWFENEFGVVLSYEQSRSGACGWVLGDPFSSRVFYVLRLGHEPRGEDFGQWLSTDPDEVMNPPPTFVGAGERVPSLKKLTTWIRDGRSRNEMNGSGRTMIPYLLSLKGHGIRLLEGGWDKEAIQVLDLVVDQALALAVGDPRCSPAELERISNDAKAYKTQAMNMLSQRRTTSLDGEEVRLDILFEGFVLNLFDDQSRRVELCLLDKDTLSLNELVVGDPMRLRKGSTARKFSLLTQLGCCSVTPPVAKHPVSERWHREDVVITVGSDGVWKKLIIANHTTNRSWELSMPDETIMKALNGWKGNVESPPVPGEIGWI